MFLAWAISVCVAGLLFWLAIHFWHDSDEGERALGRLVDDERDEDNRKWWYKHGGDL